MAGYVWGIFRTLDMPHPCLVTELGFHMRPEQGQRSGSPQTAHISSIIIAIYMTATLDHWTSILHMTLEFPTLDTIQVYVRGRGMLREFINFHFETLSIADSQGRLRLYFLDMKDCVSQGGHCNWQRFILSDISKFDFNEPVRMHSTGWLRSWH